MPKLTWGEIILYAVMALLLAVVTEVSAKDRLYKCKAGGQLVYTDRPCVPNQAPLRVTDNRSDYSMYRQSMLTPQVGPVFRTLPDFYWPKLSPRQDVWPPAQDAIHIRIVK